MDGEDQKPSLESPLISQESVSETRNGAKREEILSEVKIQLKLAGPLVLFNLLLFGLQVISVMFVGHLGELALSGASMATSFASVTGFSLLIGMGCALETLCGQSYGAKQYHMLGIHKQRAMFVLLLVSIPVAFIWSKTDYILSSLGQDPEISAEAGLYAYYMLPSIFAMALLQCHVRFLQAQNNVVPMMITMGFTTLLHILTCWMLVFKSGLGNKGAALANSISYWIDVLLLAIYVRISPACKNTWTGFSKEALRDARKFLRIAIPSAVMICLETWSFEMMVLLSGLLPNPKLETSVLSISLNTCSVLYMIPLGLCCTISVRVSNELGAGRAHAAHLAVYVSLFMVAIESILVAIALVLGHNFWGYLYSNEEKVVKYVGEMMLLLAGSHFIEGLQTVLSGVVRGSGKQKIGALANLGAYYFAGIPSGALLAFVYHIGGKGLWIGIMVAVSVQASSLAIIILRTEWEKEVKKATDRVYDSLVPVNVASSISHCGVATVPFSIRVSNELGAGRAQAVAIYVALFTVAIESILLVTAMILGRKFWGYFYSSEENVVNYVGQKMLLAGSHFIEGIQSVLSDALANLGAYYFAGIPSGAFLAFIYHIGGKVKKATDRVYDLMISASAISSS